LPRKHIATLHDLTTADDPLLGHLHRVAEQVAVAEGHRDFRVVINCGAGSGQSVYHLHVHVLAGRALGWRPVEARRAGRSDPTTRASPMSDFSRRALGAARLDPTVYEEVEHDRAASVQALVIVLLSAIAGAIGRLGSFTLAALAANTIVGVFGWVVWAGFCLAIGARLVPRRPGRTATSVRPCASSDSRPRRGSARRSPSLRRFALRSWSSRRSG